MTDSARATPPPPARPPRRWVRRFVWALAAVAFLVICFPTALRVPLVRRGVLGLALWRLNGRVEIGSAPLGWLRPIELTDISVSPPSGPPAIRVGQVRGDRPLWRMVFAPGSFGTIDIVAPELALVVTEDGTNLREILRGQPDKDEPPEDEEPPPLAQTLGRLNLRLRVSEGQVSFRGRDATAPWRAEGIAAEAALEPAPGGASQLVVEPGPLVSDVAITPALCEDVLKFIAPNLAGVATARGSLSAEIDPGRIPLDDLALGQASGRLVIAQLEAGPGPLVGEVAKLLKIESALSIPPDTVIEFRLANRRVTHSRFDFYVGPLLVSMQGAVGLDQSLDLELEVPVPGQLLGQGTLAQALAEQTIVLPVRGTLAKPEIDARALTQSSVQALLGVVEALLRGDGVTEESLTADLATQGLIPAGSLLEEWLKQRAENGGGFLRRRRAAARQAEAVTPSASPTAEEPVPGEAAGETVGDPTAAPPATEGGIWRDGPLRRLLRERMRGTPPPAEPEAAEPEPPDAPPAEALPEPAPVDEPI